MGKLRLLGEAIKNRRASECDLKFIRKSGTSAITPMDKHIISYLSAGDFKSVLEVGSGGGRLAHWFAYYWYKTVVIEPDK